MALEDIGVRAVIEGVGPFKRGIGDMNTGVARLGKSLERHSRTLKIAGAAMAALAVSVAFIGFKLTKAASDAEEMRAKFNVVFGELAQDVAKWAEETAKAVNRSRFDFIKWLAALQDTFVPLGFARDKAAEFSKQLVTLAVDVASFNNVVEADVIRDFQSALVGNTETVRKYGIILTEANTKQEILNQGWAQSEKEITDSMKVQARLNIIMMGTTDAQGDAARTAGTFANQMRGLDAAVLELKVSLGQRLLPIMTQVISKLTNTVNWLTNLPGPIGDAVVGFLGLAASVAAVASPALLFLGFLPAIGKGLAMVKAGIIGTSRAIIGTLIPALAKWTLALVKVVAAQVAVLATKGPVGIAILAAAAVAAAAGFVALGKAVGGFQGGGTIGSTGMALVGEQGPELVRLPAAASDMIKGLGGFQGGGTAGSTGMALVGERGPELVHLPAAAQVTPVSRNTSYNVTAHYASPQMPQGIRLDLEALAMMARR